MQKIQILIRQKVKYIKMVPYPVHEIGQIYVHFTADS